MSQIGVDSARNSARESPHSSMNSMSSLPINTHRHDEHTVRTPGPKVHGAKASWKPSVFDFKSEKRGSACPTCKGSGRIPKGQEDELVALIPYSDKRLKPRRTYLYVLCMALVLIVIGGVLTAFFYPRSVVIDLLSINSTHPNNDTDTHFWDIADNHSFEVKLEVEVIVNVKSANFFPVNVLVLNVTLMYSENEVGSISGSEFTVAPRASKTVSVLLNATFLNALSKRVNSVCLESQGWSQNIYLKANALAQYSYLSQTSVSVGEKGKRVVCEHARRVVHPPTISPTLMRNQVT